MPEKVGKCKYEGCNRKVLPNSKYCICHEKRDDKDIEEFNREIEKIMQDKEAEFYDFRGFYFPESFDFEVIYKYLKDRMFDKDVNFEKAIFYSVDFERTKFSNKIDFTLAIFQKDANFKKAIFDGETHFNGATFQGIAYFIGAEFQLAYFKGAIFSKKAEFINAKFRRVNFENAFFQKKATFEAAIFKDVTFFERAEFQENANFRHTKFWAVSFGESKFWGESHFEDAEFQETIFELVIFDQDTSFRRAEFQEETYFSNVTITGNINFMDTIFKKRVDFRDCRTVEKINFNFYRTEFHDELLLTIIEGQPLLDFRNTRFSDKIWIGAKTDLKNAIFHFSRAELVDFTDAKFPEKIYEERLLEKKFHGQLEKDEEEYCPDNWQEVSTIYRKLKQAHQRHGDYIKAGEFFYREMESKKKALREKRFSRDWFRSFGYSFLKYSCGYGEKPGTVIKNSILAVFGFAFAYLFSNSINLYGNSVVRKFLQSLYFSTITFTTLGYGDIHPINDTGRILAMSEAIMGAIFVALFIFVFSRKMMR